MAEGKAFLTQVEQYTDCHMINCQANPTDSFRDSGLGEKTRNAESCTAFFNVSEAPNGPSVSEISVVK